MSTNEDEFTLPLHGGFAGSFLQFPHVKPSAVAIRKAGAKAAIYGMPWDATSISRTGASYGPRAVRNESAQFLTYNATLDFDVAEALHPVDCGDVRVVPANAEKTFANAQRDVGEILDGGALPIVLGGDHSVTIPGVRAVAERHERPGLILIDTHLDTNPETEGETLNHTCDIARALDAGFPGEKIALVGISGWMNPSGELAAARDAGISIFWIEDIWANGVQKVAERALQVATNGTDGFYLSLDLDGLDAAFFPGTCCPTPGGLTAREYIELTRAFAGSGKVLSADITEIAPTLDPTPGGVQTALMAGRVALEVMAFHAGASYEPKSL